MKNKKIKICHVAHKLTGKSDGVFTHLKMLLELLNKDKFEQILMYSGNERKIDDYAKSLNVKVYKIPELNNKIPLNSFFKIIRIFLKEDVDIIHTHLVKPYIIAGLINLLLNRKLIFNYQGVFITSKYYSRFERIILKFLHRIVQFRGNNILAIGPSKASIEELKREAKFQYYSYYYNGFRINSFKNELDQSIYIHLTGLKQNYFLVGIVARHEKQKRLDIALKILKALHENRLNIFFVFIGDGPLMNNTKIEAYKMGISEKCLFIEYLTNLPSYLRLFDLVLFTSEWEGFPLTIWEAMYNEVPVVSSDVGGVKEILENENCGLVYPFGEVEKCVNIIKELYFDRERLKVLGKNGRKSILEKYNEKHFKEFFETLYLDLSNE